MPRVFHSLDEIWELCWMHSPPERRYFLRNISIRTGDSCNMLTLRDSICSVFLFFHNVIISVLCKCCAILKTRADFLTLVQTNLMGHSKFSLVLSGKGYVIRGSIFLSSVPVFSMLWYIHTQITLRICLLLLRLVKWCLSSSQPRCDVSRTAQDKQKLHDRSGPSETGLSVARVVLIR